MWLMGAVQWATAKLLPSSVTNNFISVQAKLYFIMLPAQNIPLAETFPKEAHLRETEWRSPECRPPAHAPFLSPQSPQSTPRALKAFSSPWIFPELTLCFQLPSAWLRGQSQNTVFTHMGSYEALRLDITSSDLLLSPALSGTPAPLTTRLHVTLWAFLLFPSPHPPPLCFPAFFPTSLSGRLSPP